jgi:protein tyrosine kinase modulator
MIENRELNMDDYLSMLRRRMKVILIPALLAPIAGFLISYAFAPKYTSQSIVSIEDQKVPEGYVKSVITEDAAQRVASMQTLITSQSRLRPMIERLGLAKKGKSEEEVADDIRQNLSLQEVLPDITAQKRKMGRGADFVAFSVNYTADNPKDAKLICDELTSMLISENLTSRAQAAESTTDFLSRQVEESKKNLEDLDGKLANFKKQYMGQLPGDEDNNMRILMGLNSQLEANTQTLNRAQQDKSYTESMLAQQLSAWKTSQISTNPTTIEQQLAAKQSELITLQARYTDDYPDVAKAKADIAELKRQLARMNAATAPTDTIEKSTAGEPLEIRQLRLQVHQYETAMAQASREQKRLQDQIGMYQGRVSLSPAVEEQYKALTRDYETAQKSYNELLSKKSQSQMATEMERAQQGEQMRLTSPASLPEKPSFPNRLLFAGGGLGLGLSIGLGLALWLEMRDKSIRTEQDVLAVLELPMLVSVPWLGADAGERSSYGHLQNRSRKSPDESKETVEV